MSAASGPRKDPGLIYDVGLHKGEDTAFYLNKGFRVVAFEADPALAAQCRARFAAQIASGELTLVEGAICEPEADGERRTHVRFFRNRDNSVWGTVDDRWAARNESLGTANEVIEVPVVDFAECLRRHGVPHYIKIDIEGMDRVCLRALAACEERPDYVSIEAEKVDFDRLTEELRLLCDLGYVDFKAVQQAGISRQREPSPAREGRQTGYRFAEGSSGLFGEDLPGHWLGPARIVEAYRGIFREYRWFGDHAMLPRLALGRLLIKVLIRLFDRPFPGWYDTHARHRLAPAATASQSSLASP